MQNRLENVVTSTSADGYWNVTIVDGTELVGLFATDGSMNVVQSDGSLGARLHPSGATRVTVSDTTINPGGSVHAPDGSLYVAEDPADGGQTITIISGAFS